MEVKRLLKNNFFYPQKILLPHPTGAEGNVIPRFDINVCGSGSIIEQVWVADQASVGTLAEIKHVNSEA